MSIGSTLILVGHGTRLPRGRRALGLLAASVRRQWDGPVRLCFVDVQPPTPLRVLDDLGEAASATPEDAAGTGESTVVVPGLLSTGFHVKVDIPQAIAESGQPVMVAPPLGPSEELAAVLADIVRAATGGHDPAAAVLAATGSSDPEAAADVRRQARLLSESLGGAPVSVGFASAGDPALGAALADAPPDSVVISYLLAPGFFADRIAAAAQDRGLICTPPLLAAGDAAVEAISRLVVARALGT